MQDIIWASTAIAFILILWLLVRMRGRFFHIKERLFQKLGFGLMAISLWALANFFQHYAPIEDLQSESLMLIFEIAGGISLMAGIFFCTVGIIGWFSLWRRNSPRFRLKRVFPALVAKLSALEDSENPDQFVQDVSRNIVESFLPDFFTLEKFMENGKILMLDSRLPKNEAGHKEKETEKKAEKTDPHTGFERIRLNFTDAESNRYALSCMFRTERGGFPEEINLRQVQEITNNRLKHLRQRNAERVKLRMAEFKNSLFNLADKSEDIVSYLKLVFPHLQDMIQCDYISVAVVDNAIQNMYRYSYIEVGGKLVENGICYPLARTSVLDTARKREMMVTGSLQSDFYRDDYHLYKSGFSSRLSYPLINMLGELKGVLTLAAVKPKAFDRVRKEEVDLMNIAFCRLIDFHTVSTMMTTLKKQIVSNFNLTFGLGEREISRDFFKQTARIVSETLPATLCRIWRYDRDRNSLNPMALHDLRGVDETLERSPERVILDRLPRHKSAIELGKALIINQSNPDFKMEKPELEALGLPSLKSAILAPMRLNNRVTGIISVGEMRNWERRSLGGQELLYSQIISAITALAFDLRNRERSFSEMKSQLAKLENYSELYQTYFELPGRLASPASAILGAAELISQKISDSDPALERYNQIILKSARDVVKNLKKYEDIRANLSTK